jgi:site-specific DNA recombinase
LITAYQEDLVTLAQLRQRMPELRKQAQAVQSELESLKMAAVDQAKYLQLADSLGAFRSKLRLRAETVDIRERQQILRLVVREVLVGDETITIRHSIPVPTSGSESNGTPSAGIGPSPGLPGPRYLLRTGSHVASP